MYKPLNLTKKELLDIFLPMCQVEIKIPNFYDVKYIVKETYDTFSISEERVNNTMNFLENNFCLLKQQLNKSQIKKNEDMEYER